MTARAHDVTVLHTADGMHALSVQLADTAWARLTGWMLRRPGPSASALLLTRCTAVHTCFMRVPIDLVYLDGRGTVTGCVRRLRPWRASCAGHGPGQPARHTLELVAGAIDAYGIGAGDRLAHPLFAAAHRAAGQAPPGTPHQRGSAMLEFTVIAPVITLIGLALLQYAMLFFARSQVNYAAFQAARAGAMAHADAQAVQRAYLEALAPLYGGGTTLAELDAARARVAADLATGSAPPLLIEQLNPTRESFADWNDTALQARHGGRRAIPNSRLGERSQAVGGASGQTLREANMFKLRVTHGYAPKVPVVGPIYARYLAWVDDGSDALYSRIVGQGRVPLAASVTLHMQSDPVEAGPLVSRPGPGNGGTPTAPAAPAPLAPPPTCTTLACRDPAEAAPPPARPCNPSLDPQRCAPTQCIPTANMCCMPT